MFGEKNMIVDPKCFKSVDAPVEGYFSEEEQYRIIQPEGEWEYAPARKWLKLGGPGVDGIEFGYLEGKSGVFAYYPIDEEFVHIANSASELLRGWANGTITVWSKTDE